MLRQEKRHTEKEAPLAKRSENMDKSIMKLVADRRGRLTSVDLFRPGAAFNAERQSDGSIRLVELVEKEVRVVRPIRTKEGFIIVPAKLGRKAIAAALRIDRGSQ